MTRRRRLSTIDGAPSPEPLLHAVVDQRSSVPIRPVMTATCTIRGSTACYLRYQPLGVCMKNVVGQWSHDHIVHGDIPSGRLAW